MTDTPAAPRHPAAIEFGGVDYLRDAKGNLVPIASIKAQDLLIDEVARLLVAIAEEESARIKAFKVMAFERVTELRALLAQQYGAKMGGPKGNVQLLTFDGCQRVQLQVADLIELGPELEAAKALIDECLSEWAVGSGVELRTLVTRVFQVGKGGQINRAELMMLLRYEFEDERWKNAMQAIRDSIRVVGSREYMRFYKRPEAEGQWCGITVDMASA